MPVMLRGKMSLSAVAELKSYGRKNKTLKVASVRIELTIIWSRA